ncbi:hypothetical protein D3C83_85340 [compost metagenome]
MTDRVRAHTEVSGPLGAAGAGGDDDVVERPALELRPLGAVVSHHDGLLAVHLGQQLEEVEGERVVVVDQQRSHASRS